MNINAVAWGTKQENGDSVLYTMQVSLKGKRQINKFNKEAQGWEQTGEGFDPTTENTIMLFRRSFQDKRSWIEYAKTLPFPVQELNSRTGKTRIINGKRRYKK